MFGPSAFYLCGRRGEDFVCIDVRSDISLSVQQLIRARPNCLLVPAENSAVIMDIDLYQDLKKIYGKRKEEDRGSWEKT